MENNRANQELEMLASFPVLNPNPIVEIDVASQSLTYANPTSLRLFPTIKNDGMRHPFLSRLDDAISALDKENSFSREVKVGDRWFVQSIHRLPESQNIRVYAQDITRFKEDELEVERLNKAMIGRELKMSELKKEVAELKKAIAELKKNCPIKK